MIEDIPRSELPWRAAYGKVKSNRDNFSKLFRENVERFDGTNKIYNSENISSFGAKRSDPMLQNNIALNVLRFS